MKTSKIQKPKKTWFSFFSFLCALSLLHQAFYVVTIFMLILVETKLRESLYQVWCHLLKAFRIQRFQNQFCSARFAEEWAVEDKKHLLINTCNIFLDKFLFSWLWLLICMQVVGDAVGEIDYFSLILEMFK